ncbi:HD domain-containing phosphohydrolase [Leadbettera azotonutricia]|uniref:Regulatory components of sensory transduction system n=1 Tax=Leadbettera azotonutricia (strain ATCC BAA-888 / DSM 13862 / ZAS-9) TaxID=545695 RepID=F5Y900_LEAAZ|nr:regulatory components of sensory transduction system [Leadbettera azotonutricia ZAS-9]
MNDKKAILLVDDNPSNLSVGKNVLKNIYNVFTIPSGEKLFDILEKIDPSLILLDIEMPGMSGYDVIKKLKADPVTMDIPVIFLTSFSDPGSELEGLNLGAVDYISKPFSPPLLIKRIQNHLLMDSQKKELEDFNLNLQSMVKEKTKDIMELQNSIVQTVVEMVEFKDDITGGHIERTQNYLKSLVNDLRINKIYWKEVSSFNMEFFISSSQLHDVGKIAISDTILNKPGRLTAEEFEIMKQHAIKGEEAIQSIMLMSKKNDFLENAKIFAGTHHEKWDGSGYPRGLKGEEIPLQGRLMAIADVYDALTAHRPYKQPMSCTEAEEIIYKGSGTHFDPTLVEVFYRLAPEFAAISKQNGKIWADTTAA